MLETEVVDGEHAHAERDLGADGVERGVEGFFGDGELGQADGYDAVFAPDEKGEWLFEGDDFEGAGVGHVVVGDERFDGWIDEHLELRELRLQAELDEGSVFGFCGER